MSVSNEIWLSESIYVARWGKNDNFDTEFGKIEEKTLAIPDKIEEEHNRVFRSPQ